MSPTEQFPGLYATPTGDAMRQRGAILLPEILCRANALPESTEPIVTGLPAINREDDPSPGVQPPPGAPGGDGIPGEPGFAFFDGDQFCIVQADGTIKCVILTPPGVAGLDSGDASIMAFFDGGGSKILNLTDVYQVIPFDCVVKQVVLLSDGEDIAGNDVVVGFYRTTAAAWPPTFGAAGTVSGDRIGLAVMDNADTLVDSALGFWTDTVLKRGDGMVFRFFAQTASVTKLVAALLVEKAGGGDEVTIIQGVGAGGGHDGAPDLPGYDEPPTVPNAMDDEFNDASFDTALWSWIQTEPTISEADGHVTLSAMEAAEIIGMVQAIPAGDFDIRCRVSLGITEALTAATAGRQYIGLGIFDGSGDADDCDFITIRTGNDGMTLRKAVFGTIDPFGSLATQVTTPEHGQNHAYFRVVRTGSTYKWYWSSDGLAWVLVDSNATRVAGTPSDIGIIFLDVPGSSTVGVVDWFRRFS